MLLGCLVRHFSLLTSLQCRKQIVAPPPPINFIKLFYLLWGNNNRNDAKVVQYPAKKKNMVFKVSLLSYWNGVIGCSLLNKKRRWRRRRQSPCLAAWMVAKTETKTKTTEINKYLYRTNFKQSNFNSKNNNNGECYYSLTLYVFKATWKEKSIDFIYFIHSRRN